MHGGRRRHLPLDGRLRHRRAADRSINGFLTFIVLTILGVPFAVPLAVVMAFFA